MKIVSLLPSATEIVCAVGLREQLVGVTHECDFPPSVRELPVVTRSLIPSDAPSGEIDRMVRERLRSDRALYTLDLPTLEQLKPDLIVTQALCDVCAVAEAEVQAAACSLPGNPRVVNLEPQTLREVLGSIRLVGQVAGAEAVADSVARGLAHRVERVAVRSRMLRLPPRVVVLEWLDPPFSCGHWNPELVRLAGGTEVLGREGQPSRTLRWEEVKEADPDAILVSCCGFGLDRTMEDVRMLSSNPWWRELAAVRSERVYVVDGSQYFSRPGPRLVDSLEILAHALHPMIHALPAGLPAARAMAKTDRARDARPAHA
jgi:iron complex transport system substrate-binding protein